MMMNHCAACDRPILDRFLLNVLDRTWHARCVQCVDCSAHLNEKCFTREGKLYCKRDFIRRFGTKCAGCGMGISPTDLVRRARQDVFHLKCFTCMVCRKQLSTGEELYVLSEGRFICKEDYLKSGQGLSDNEDEDLELDSNINDNPSSVASDKDVFDDECLSRDGSMSELQLSVPPHDITCGSPAGQHSASSPRDPANNNNNNNVSSNKENVDDANNNANGEAKTEGIGAKRRGPRTTIKAKQLETLKAAFAATPKPTRHIREQLAQETGLNMRVIQVWFQNRRSKERRMKQLSALGARRHFFRNPRRMRALRAGMSPHDLDDNPDVMGAGPFGYFPGQGEFYHNFQGYNPEFFHQNPDHPHMPFMTTGGPVEQGMDPAQFGLPPHGDLPPGVQPSPSPEPGQMAVMTQEGHYNLPTRGQFQGMVGHPPPDMPVENW